MYNFFRKCKNLTDLEDCLGGVPHHGRGGQQNNLELGENILGHGEVGLLLQRGPTGHYLVLTQHRLLRQGDLSLDQPAVERLQIFGWINLIEVKF